MGIGLPGGLSFAQIVAQFATYGGTTAFGGPITVNRDISAPGGAADFITTLGGLQLSSGKAIYFNGGTQTVYAAFNTPNLELGGAPISAVSGFKLNGKFTQSATAPTIGSGFGTSPSIVTSNGTAAFTINVGTGGVATSGVLTLPAATTGWVCHCVNLSNAATNITRQTATTSTSITLGSFSATTGASLAWAASDVIAVLAMAY